MSNKTEHHLEHAEHAEHATHDPFDRRVTVTIAITAALLACVTMLSHRAHTRTLQLQLQANDAAGEATNQWNYYQSKKNRQYQYETAQRLVEENLAHPSLRPSENGYSVWKARVEKDLGFWKEKVTEYRNDTDKIETEAREFSEEAKNLRKESEHMHHIGDRYDLGELGVELGLVLCSLAVLTKRRNFWLGGIGFSLAGVALMLWGVAGQYMLH